MRHPTSRQVVRQIARLEKFVNNWRMLPATKDPRNAVFLALLSKALNVGRAVCTLVLSGFPTEAFGLSRTLIEIYFSLRYMGSRETQERVTTYIEYGTRVKKEWFDINAKYYPERKLHLSSSHDEEMKTAAKFKS